jgi:hypothetical protein
MENLIVTEGTKSEKIPPIKEETQPRVIMLKGAHNETGNEQDDSVRDKSSGFAGTSKFPLSVYQNLPDNIRQLTEHFDDNGRQRDIFLFSLLHVLSACMPNVYGLYFGKMLSPNLFGMVGGPSGTGKSAMEVALSITEPIIRTFAEYNRAKKEQYMAAMAMYKLDKTLPKPEKPKPNLFVIPANNSAAGIIKLLEGSPYTLIAETEADTLGNILGQKNFGNWSDLLRKLYHHEPYRYYRKTDDEYIELLDRHLSLILTGTPQQVKNLLKGAEMGLLSRIGFYVYDEKPIFIDPFRDGNRKLTNDSRSYAVETARMFTGLLKKKDGVEFRFTRAQAQKFIEKFRPIVDDYYDLEGNNAASVAMRLGVIFFRLAMILTVLRSNEENVLVCNDTDFQTANLITDLLAEHAVAVISSFPPSKDAEAATGALNEKIIDSIPTDQFETKWLRETLAKQGMSRTTVFRLITRMEARGKIRKVRHGVYQKVK